MAEQVEEGLTEAGQDEVDLRVQSVCTELGSPSEVSMAMMAFDSPDKDRVRSSEDTIVDDEIVWRQAGNHFLNVSLTSRCSLTSHSPSQFSGKS